MSLVREPEGVTLSKQRIPTDTDDEDFEEYAEDQLTELHMAASAGHMKDVVALFGGTRRSKCQESIRLDGVALRGPSRPQDNR
jgi:hypothetical protein